jgi:hypothetical protein
MHFEVNCFNSSDFFPSPIKGLREITRKFDAFSVLSTDIISL